MNSETFFENLDLLCEAPNSIEKLRELILQLAVMGKLVPQDPKDEEASVLLERIIAEKEKLMQERKIRKSDLSFRVNQEDVPIELPMGWKWTSIGEVSILQGGKRLPKGADFSTFPTPHIYIQVTNMKNGTIEENGLKYIDEEVYNSIQKYIIEQDDLYITIAGTIGQVGEVPARFHMMNLTENAAKIVFRGLNKKYLLLSIRSDFVQTQFSEKTNQQAQPKLALKRIESTIFPLPPLAEQKRIVSKVDELMALCDKLEIRRQKKQEIQSKLNSAALDKMLSAENQKEFEQYWQHICENFDLLYDNPENVEKLKQAILQLAVQGKLVEQNSEDEPASVLIEKIEAAKEKLCREGKSQKTKVLPKICLDELPYDLPNSWTWIRLADISTSLRYGTSKKCAYNAAGTPVLRIPNIVNGKIDTSDLKFTQLSAKEIEDLNLDLGDLLLIRSNGSTSLVGRSAVIDNNLTGYAYAGYLVRLRIFPTYISSDYLHLALESSYVRDQIEMPIRTTSGVKNINSFEISRLILPIPPLNEQKRIVEKVEQFMGLCDELEFKLRKSLEDSEKLMEAVVKGLLEDAAAEKTEIDMPVPLQVASIQLK